VGNAPEDADTYFGRVPRDAKPSTRTGRAAALTVYFQFLELRHRAEMSLHTGPDFTADAVVALLDVGTGLARHLITVLAAASAAARSRRGQDSRFFSRRY
jgi:hypothetical protein